MSTENKNPTQPVSLYPSVRMDFFVAWWPNQMDYTIVKVGRSFLQTHGDGFGSMNYVEFLQKFPLYYKEVMNVDSLPCPAIRFPFDLPDEEGWRTYFQVQNQFFQIVYVLKEHRIVWTHYDKLSDPIKNIVPYIDYSLAFHKNVVRVARDLLQNFGNQDGCMPLNHFLMCFPMYYFMKTGGEAVPKLSWTNYYNPEFPEYEFQWYEHFLMEQSKFFQLAKINSITWIMWTPYENDKDPLSQLQIDCKLCFHRVREEEFTVCTSCQQSMCDDCYNTCHEESHSCPFCRSVLPAFDGAIL